LRVLLVIADKSKWEGRKNNSNVCGNSRRWV